MTKTYGYWKKEENVLAEARQIMKEHGWTGLPSADKLGQKGYFALIHAINRHHGGIQNIRKSLGQQNTTKPNGYWKILDNTITEAQQAMNQEGWNTLPSADKLVQKGYSSLSVAINKYHGGIQQFRTTLGQQNPQKNRGFWQQEENVIVEVQKAMREQEWITLPSQQELTKHGYSALSNVISKYHGGMQQFRTTLGQTNTKKPNGYWENLENVVVEARQAMQEQEWNTLPTQQELKTHRYHSLASSISKYHGGLNTFRTTLGQTNTTKPNGYWQQEKNAITEALKAMGEQEWNTLPPARELAKHRYNSLSRAISRYHGGFHNFRKLLFEHTTGKTQKQQLEELLDEYIAA